MALAAWAWFGWLRAWSPSLHNTSYDGAAASCLWRNISQLSNLSSGTALSFFIAGRDALPGQLSSFLGVLHLFTLLGMSIVMLCNTTTSLFLSIVLSRNYDFYYVFLI